MDTLDSTRAFCSGSDGQSLSNPAIDAGLGFFAPMSHTASSLPDRAASSSGTARDPGSLRQPYSPTAAQNRATPHQILLVEDDSAVREVSLAMLVRAGYQVNAVDGSQAAWEALQYRSYDLLITDNRMPGMTGLELVRKLRSAQLALPVILASGGVGEEELTQNEWLQPATLLPKPFTRDALLEMVITVLSPASRAHNPTTIPARARRESYRHWGINE